MPFHNNTNHGYVMSPSPRIMNGYEMTDESTTPKPDYNNNAFYFSNNNNNNNSSNNNNKDSHHSNHDVNAMHTPPLPPPTVAATGTGTTGAGATGTTTGTTSNVTLALPRTASSQATWSSFKTVAAGSNNHHHSENTNLENDKTLHRKSSQMNFNSYM
ncbi:uncharacterized protein EV154DRAFT_520328 [Mucor mucedo]|uniref:uncharacterized protein n=1 Tax=Mucor mucedo TaxID=29922 RepID=UPI00221F16E9|nr:uncharacterized protein EV154DRAFT_520328 [Mucor mucedo]KAI7887649.1 hypothetical protein EV154DRAFT_520328 [Mucor mucedo]